MISFVLSFVLGVWLLQQQAALPQAHPAWLLAFLPLSLWRFCPRAFRIALLVPLTISSGFLYAAWMAHHRLADNLPAEWQGKDIVLSGVVATLPRQHEHGQSFILDVARVSTPGAHVPTHIMLSTYYDAKYPSPQPHAGERWQLTVRLKQPHGSSNPYSFDFEAWALAQNVRAVGYVNNRGKNQCAGSALATPGYFIEHLRERIRDYFQQALGSNAAYGGVLTALAIGDQASISPSQWLLFTRTGVNHLMSISGLHITMLAAIAYAICYWLWRRSVRLTLLLPARKFAALCGFLLAFAYALLAGYGVPAQRTVYMLATVALALWSARNFAPAQLLGISLLVVTLLDPWAVISPGFWLSFGAVALIFFTTANRLGTANWLIAYARIQWAMSIGLIPLLLALFQQISLVSPLANAVAIPLVSFIIIPLTLLAALLHLDSLLQLAHQFMRLCMWLLEWLNSLPDAVWIQHAPPSWTILLGTAGVCWMLLPRGFPARWLGALMMLPMFFYLPQAQPCGTLRLLVFDVGQGLALALQTQQHVLLYDSGPDFNGETDSGNRILLPALRGLDIDRLDALILSHDDLDHTGGAISILQNMPVNWVSSSLEKNHVILQYARDSRRCRDGQQWDWDGVHFEMLHPAPENYADPKVSNNNLGCVLRISMGKQVVLITADIEQASEQRLLQTHPDKLAASVLLVPHHGSKTSSTLGFVRAVHPRYAIFAAGYRNRFHHPFPDVLERYHKLGSELLRSDRDGAIIFNINAEQLSYERYRLSHAHYWYQSQY